MNITGWRGIGWLRELLATRQPEPADQAQRIVAMQLHIVLPAKAGVIAVTLYYVFFADWFRELPTIQAVVLQSVQGFFIAYVISNLLATGALLAWKRFPPGMVQWIVFTLGLLDGIFMGAMVFLTGGLESIAYWIFPGLIVLNAMSIPLAAPQLVLNLLLSAFYLSAGLLEAQLPPPTLLDLPANAFRSTPRRTNVTELVITNQLAQPNRWINSLPYTTVAEERSSEPVAPRLFVLWLLAVCCYGVQVLAERQRRVAEEERESAVREAQLHSAGRLAAEFAHQIKNPLAIINNAAFSVQRALKSGRTDVARQIEIIQEEVERSDRIVTQIMGYAQLTEGRVEKLDVAEELDRAVDEVFPRGVETGIRVRRNYVRAFPPLLMQRRHFADILINLLQNAREALEGRSGEVSVTAVCRSDSSLEISVRDNGPGVPPDKVERIFEAYFTTKEKGTGLGLSIVKHNAELYSGTVRLESELGKGSRFILTFPAKTVISPVKQQ